MAAPKGHKKYGGRAKGAPNKRTEQWEQFVEYCMNGGLEKFQTEMEKLTGKDYVSAFANLLEFHKPKLTRSTLVGDKENPVTVKFTPIGNNGRGK